MPHLISRMKELEISDCTESILQFIGAWLLIGLTRYLGSEVRHDYSKSF
jgi:hypothetical protein